MNKWHSDTVDYYWKIAKLESWHWGEAIYNRIVTWTAFAILAMFFTSNSFLCEPVYIWGWRFDKNQGSVWLWTQFFEEDNLTFKRHVVSSNIPSFACCFYRNIIVIVFVIAIFITIFIVIIIWIIIVIIFVIVIVIVVVIIIVIIIAIVITTAIICDCESVWASC